MRGLRGAPASMFLALVLCGHALRNSQLMEMTGYSDKTIAKGLALLELRGLAQNNGYQYGWSLTAGVRQLPLFPESLLGIRPARVGNSDSTYGISDSLTTTTTTKDSLREKRVVVVSKNGVGNSDSGDVDPVETWLIHGGIGRNSTKLRHLIELDMDPEYVKAHVLERLAIIEQPDGAWFHTGLLIRRLLDGDAAPPMRCPDCLRIERSCICDNICPTCGAEISQSFGVCLYCSGVIQR